MSRRRHPLLRRLRRCPSQKRRRAGARPPASTSREKCRTINCGDHVFDGDKHRTPVGLDVVGEQRSWPMHRRREIETGRGLKSPAPQQRDGGDQRDRRDDVNGREPDHLRRLSPDDAADGQACELRGCEHRHPAPADPARHRELGRYVQGGDRGNPANSSKHAGDQTGCGLASDREQDERKCGSERRSSHDPIGTQLCRCGQYECAANSAGADRT